MPFHFLSDSGIVTVSGMVTANSWLPIAVRKTSQVVLRTFYSAGLGPGGTRPASDVLGDLLPGHARGHHSRR